MRSLFFISGSRCAKLPGVPPFTISPASLTDTEEILALQSLNHVSALPAQTLANGFVTTQLSAEVIAELCAYNGIWTARSKAGDLAAYACAVNLGFHGDGSFQSAVKALLPLPFDGGAVTAQNCIQYGPVCVAAAFRGHGILEELIEIIKTHYGPRFEFGITFIDDRNLRSLAAHERKLGFRRLALLPYAAVTYHLLAFRCA